MTTTKHRITKWTEWPTSLKRAVKAYRQKHGSYPTGMHASTATFRRMSIAADRSRVGNADRQAPEQAGYVQLSGIVIEDNRIDFVIDDSYASGTFMLM